MSYYSFRILLLIILCTYMYTCFAINKKLKTKNGKDSKEAISMDTKKMRNKSKFYDLHRSWSMTDEENEINTNEANDNLKALVDFIKNKHVACNDRIPLEKLEQIGDFMDKNLSLVTKKSVFNKNFTKKLPHTTGYHKKIESENNACKFKTFKSYLAYPPPANEKTLNYENFEKATVIPIKVLKDMLKFPKLKRKNYYNQDTNTQQCDDFYTDAFTDNGMENKKQSTKQRKNTRKFKISKFPHNKCCTTVRTRKTTSRNNCKITNKLTKCLRITTTSKCHIKIHQHFNPDESYNIKDKDVMSNTKISNYNINLIKTVGNDTSNGVNGSYLVVDVGKLFSMYQFQNNNTVKSGVQVTNMKPMKKNVKNFKHVGFIVLQGNVSNKPEIIKNVSYTNKHNITSIATKIYAERQNKTLNYFQNFSNVLSHNTMLIPTELSFTQIWDSEDQVNFLNKTEGYIGDFNNKYTNQYENVDNVSETTNGAKR